ncbi:hypothetical protein HDE_04068 [Halotydeus destructor]|nr:hypothetical protein HDE_04068 [Halotydeus destructor]
MKLTALILIAIYINGAYCCSCIPPDAKRIYCASTYAGAVKVNKGPVDCTPFTHCYDVTQTKVLKSQPGVVVKNITTPNSSAACGRSYTVGGTYLVVGNPITGGSMGTNLCGWEENWTAKSEAEIAEREAFFAAIDCDA